ncbi:winged helix-turn-helix domain-containing protein [Aeromonas jandaei]|uniref:winged helix-turn-helix domain-containing protein n=1 Tax=Aeromonas jandaei TaxID=650 RepID=UPI00191D4D9F|nr:winged helix-turn-helix domain-containing protein [Aeromonas jandaei]MBL0667040.1 winged helix-turn-helix domain-containing protein [Aeromonas jandaei]
MADNEANQISHNETFLINGNIVFNRISSELSHDGKYIKLAYTEANLLLMLILNKNSIVTRERLIEFSWGERVVTDSSLAKSISNLRKALRKLGQNDDCIITVPRLGYRFTLQAHAIEIEDTDEINTFSNEQLLPPPSSNSLTTIGNSINWFKTKSMEKTYKARNKILTFASLGLLIMSGYNICLYVDHDLSKKHIAHGYEEKNLIINGSRYTIVKKKGQEITDEISSIISMASPNSTIFFQNQNGVYNISISIKNHTSSFSFKDANIERAKCQIKGVISKESFVCEH